jgi:hypothetical protein
MAPQPKISFVSAGFAWHPVAQFEFVQLGPVTVPEGSAHS